MLSDTLKRHRMLTARYIYETKGIKLPLDPAKAYRMKYTCQMLDLRILRRILVYFKATVIDPIQMKII